MPALAEQLEHWAPGVLATYPTMALLLAEERAAGRLRIAPGEIWTGGESLTDAMRRRISAVFACGVFDSYGASEFLPLAAQCRLGALHLNCDWLLLEPVDERGRAVPPGVGGHTTLLTNLANHAQPLIRYDIGDRVTVHPQRCACGSSLPTISVEGRCDEVLVLHEGKAGKPARLAPLALTTVLEDAGAFDFELVQIAPDALRLSVTDCLAGRAREALRRYLNEQGLTRVRLEVVDGGMRPCQRSGKRRRVFGSASAHAA